jgi:hypothetical protein
MNVAAMGNAVAAADQKMVVSRMWHGFAYHACLRLIDFVFWAGLVLVAAESVKWVIGK